MPWSTPTLKEVRSLVRDNIRGSLPGADASVPNSVLRVMSDAQGGLCHLTLQYIDWLALQLLPDTAETEWLDRHGDIWLVNSDGTTGRKQATFSSGTVSFTGIPGTIVPQGTQLAGAGPVGSDSGVGFETTDQITIGTVPTVAPVRALDPGIIGNFEQGAILHLSQTIPGVDNAVTVVDIAGGVDTENDDDLRARVLRRIRQPPMGGAAYDYEAWALAVPGVTRAWCYPLEMGIGTVTTRFMMDELRADNEGFPLAEDVQAVSDYINIKRPVAVKDYWVVAPIKQPISCVIADLVPDTADVRAEIEASLRAMLHIAAAPGQTIFSAWKTFAIMSAPNIVSFRLVNNTDDVMPDHGHMAVLGSIIYDTPSAVVPAGAIPILS